MCLLYNIECGAACVVFVMLHAALTPHPHHQTHTPHTQLHTVYVLRYSCVLKKAEGWNVVVYCECNVIAQGTVELSF